jgi:hypothetical protein
VIWMVVVAEVCRSAPKSTSQKVRDRARWPVPENRLAFGQLPLTSEAIRWEIQKVLPLLRQLLFLTTAYRSSNGHLIFPLTSNHGYSACSGCRRRRSRLLRTPLYHHYAPKKILTSYRVVPVLSRFAGTVVVLVLSAKHSTRVDSRRR